MANRCAVRVSIALAAGLALAAGGVAGSAGSARALVATPAAGAATPAVAVAGGTLSTVAGGVGGPGPARSVAMVNACGLRAAGASLYIGTGAGNIGLGSALRRVNVVTGALTTVAGNGAAGPVGDGGAATATAVGPCSSTVDPAGNLVDPRRPDGAAGGGQDRHVLRPEDDRRPPVHGGGRPEQRAPAVDARRLDRGSHRRRRPGHQGLPRVGGRRHVRPGREHADRGFRVWGGVPRLRPGGRAAAGGGGQDRHLLRGRDEGGRHLLDRRPRRRSRARAQWRPGGRGVARPRAVVGRA